MSNTYALNNICFNGSTISFVFVLEVSKRIYFHWEDKYTPYILWKQIRALYFEAHQIRIFGYFSSYLTRYICLNVNAVHSPECDFYMTGLRVKRKSCDVHITGGGYWYRFDPAYISITKHPKAYFVVYVASINDTLSTGIREVNLF